MKNCDISSSAAFSDTKPHYHLLDGLRGVAALLVVWYHVFEGYAFAGAKPTVECINHGYLCVDFFFMLSGFVIGYAYDDRWNRSMTFRDFLRRRLIRLHPMVILGALIGAITFLVQGSVQWDGTHVGLPYVLLALLFGLLLLPAIPGCCYEVRGNGELFPLNGPAWSLFFEYIGNLLYALWIRRLSHKALLALTLLLGGTLTVFAVTNASGYGCIGVGWTLDSVNFTGGLLRMLFPFTVGLLLSRRFRPRPVRGAFWICSAVLGSLLFVPYFAADTPLLWNGVFEMFCIACVFPVLVWIGASGDTTDPVSTRICRFLGDLSYPLYIVHYPFMYLFYAWLIRTEQFSFGETWQTALCVYGWNILVAWACLKLYDEPVRKWLSKRQKFRTFAPSAKK